jgi:hypothetical protein
MVCLFGPPRDLAEKSRRVFLAIATSAFCDMAQVVQKQRSPTLTSFFFQLTQKTEKDSSTKEIFSSWVVGVVTKGEPR